MRIIMDHLGKSFACFCQWVKVDSRNPDAWYGMGVVLSRLGYYSFAERAFRKVLSINPDDAFAWSDLGAVHSRMGQLDKALEARNEAKRIDPGIEKLWIRSSDNSSPLNLTVMPETIQKMQSPSPIIADLLSNLLDGAQ